MKIAGKQVPGFIVAIGVVIGLMVLLQIAAWTVLPALIGNTIRSSVGRASGGLYQMSFDQPQLQLFRQSLSLENVQLTYDTARVNQSDSLKRKGVYSGSVDYASVNVGSLWTLLFSDFLPVEDIEIRQPTLYVHRFPAVPPADSTQQQDPAPLFNAYRLIRPRLDSLRVESLTVDSAGFRLIKHRSQKQSDTISIDGLRLKIQEAYVDSVVARQHHGWPRMQRAVLSWHHPTLTSVDSLYNYLADSLQIDLLKGSFALHQFSAEPRWDKYEMGQQFNQTVNWMELEVDSLTATAINFPLLTDSLILKAERLAIHQADFTLFRDLRLPEGPDGNPQARPLPQERLRSLPIPLRIDTIVVTKSNLRYEERREYSEELGYVAFNNTDATLYGITNLPQDSGSVLVADARTRLMDQGAAKLHFEFPLSSPNGVHRITGSMDQMDMSQINPASEPLAATEIESGTAQQMEFDMDLDNQQATGNVQLRYENLEVSLMKKRSPDQAKGLKSWLANAIVIKKSNPMDGGSLRPGPIQAQRDSTASVFNFWWSGLKSGLMVSLGISSSSSGQSTSDSE